MKISTLLSVSALLAMFSVVACSSGAVPADGSDDDTSAASKGDDDDKKTTSTDKTTTPASNTTTDKDTDTTQGGTNMTAAQQACETCMMNAEPKYKTAVECADKAADEDAANKCFEDAGCTEAAGADGPCSKAHATCATECKAADDADDAAASEQGQKCLTCVSSNAQAKAVETCFQNAKSDADADKCNDLDEKCFSNTSCKAAYDKCESECFGDQ